MSHDSTSPVTTNSDKEAALTARACVLVGDGERICSKVDDLSLLTYRQTAHGEESNAEASFRTLVPVLRWSCSMTDRARSE